MAVSPLYPHLTAAPGVDVRDLNPGLLVRLEALGRRLGRTLTISSGYRSTAAQRYLYTHPASHPGTPAAPPGTSLHEAGAAADVTIAGVPIQNVRGADQAARAVGLYPLAGDPVHVQLFPAGTTITTARTRLAATGKHGGGGILGAIGGAAGDVAGAVSGAAGDVAGAVGGAAGAAGGAVVGAITDQLGKFGARVLVYVALILGGAALFVAGVARATGLDKKAAGAAKAASVARLGAALA